MMIGIIKSKSGSWDEMGNEKEKKKKFKKNR